MNDSKYEAKKTLQKTPVWVWIILLIGLAAIVVTGCDMVRGNLSNPPNTKEYRKTTVHQVDNTEEFTSFPLNRSGEQQNIPPQSNHEPNNNTKLSSKIVWAIGDPDLASQEGMWRAANTLVWLTFLQIIVGSLTLIFLVWTLMTQREELDEARNMTRSTRAYVLKDEFSVAPANNFATAVVTLTIKNFGSTPAIDVWSNCVAQIVNFDSREALQPFDGPPRPPEIILKLGQGHHYQTNITIDDPSAWTRFINREIAFLITYFIEYKTVFEKLGTTIEEASFVVFVIGHNENRDNGEVTPIVRFDQASANVNWDHG